MKEPIMKDAIIIKENGQVRITLLDPEVIKSLNSKGHLCGHCTQLYANKCPKVEDSLQQDLRNYDFINDGFEAFSKKGIITKFCVSDCKNFEEDYEPTLQTKEERARQDQIRGDFKAFFFGADNIKEANRLHIESLRRSDTYEYDPSKAK